MLESRNQKHEAQIIQPQLLHCRTVLCECACMLPCLTLGNLMDQPTSLLCPWDFSGKNTGLGCHFLLQEIFLPRDLLHWEADFLYHWATREAQNYHWMTQLSENKGLLAKGREISTSCSLLRKLMSRKGVMPRSQPFRLTNSLAIPLPHTAGSMILSPALQNGEKLFSILFYQACIRHVARMGQRNAEQASVCFRAPSL